MSRRKIKKPKKKPQRQKPQKQQIDALVADTAARFTSSTEIAGDCIYQCESQINDIDTDLVFNKLGLEIWSPRPDAPPDLVPALAAFIAERERYCQALLELHKRFAAIAENDSNVLIDPPTDYYDLIRERIA